MDSTFYVEFEDNFRGSLEQIYAIFSNYDGLIQHILDIDNEPSLLDIGCGRGEFLRKCSKLGYQAQGIEINPQMAAICRNYGLDVQEGDAMTLLKDLPDDNFSLITAFHLIEHVNFESISFLLKECKRILKPNGILILETPSIDNLSVSSRSFYIDPTHINPVNPDLFVFLLKRIGFDMAKNFYINGGPLQNEDYDSLTRVFNGVAQDLMTLATKSHCSTKLLVENFSWEKSLKLGLTTLDACVQFDHYMRNKSLVQQQAISDLRRRIFALENRLLTITKSPLFILFEFFQKLQFLISSRLRKKKYKFSKFILQLSRYSFSTIYIILDIILKKNKKLMFLFLFFLNKITMKLGYRINNNNLLKKSLKVKEDKSFVDRNEKQLCNYYKQSSRSQRIFKHLND
jgi:SAM-dependent methyltransferase